MSNEGRRWTIYVCPECGCYESPESVARDHESGRSYCVNFDAHPLTDERSDWPPVERVEVVEAGGEGERKLKRLLEGQMDDFNEAQAEVERLRGALKEAIEFAAEGWAYADDYFREKWGYGEKRNELLAALASGPPGGEG